MSKEIEYIDTGVNWLGQIPSTWESKRIKMLTRVKRGASPRPIDNPIYFDEEGEFAWVRIADVTASERYLENTTQRLSELGSSLSVKRYPDDFFLSIAGTVGKPIITKIKCCIHDGFVYFPDLKINPEFLYYIFSTGLPYLGLGKLGTQLNLNTDTVGDIYIPIPDTSEIDKIVSFLDEKTAEIDKLILKKKTLTDLLREERSAIIDKAVTKGIDANQNFKYSDIEWLGDIPAHWKISRLKYHSYRIGDGIHSTPKYTDSSEYYFVNGNNLDNGKITIYSNTRCVDEDELNNYDLNLKEGTIFISLNGTIGNLAIYNGEKIVLGKSAAYIECQNTINNKFIFYFLQSNFIKKYFENSLNGTTIGNLSLFTLRNSSICFPEVPEQIEIVKFIENQLNDIDKIISRVDTEIDLIIEYRTSLINEIVTGKITLN